MLKAKFARILRALPRLPRLHAARPHRRPGALGALLLAALLSVGLAAWLLGPPGPAQAQPAVSSDATLRGLALLDWHSRELPLRPAFSAQTAEYGGTLPLLSTGLVQLKPTANHSGATITVDGKAVASGAKSEHFSLKINTPKRIVVAVTAEDGVTRREYAVTVTKDPRAELRGLSVSPGRLHPFVFSGLHTEYRAWVGHGDAEVKVTPTNRYDKGTITVNGHTVVSGQASPGIALAEGDNVITVTITGPDNYTSRTYTLTITRATATASADATLAGLAIHTATSSQPDAGNEVPYEGAAYPLSPALASGVYDYRVRVPEAVARRARESEESGYVYVTAVSTTTAPGARSITVQGQKSYEEARTPKREVVTGESSGPWYAFIGYSPITIEVTSLDGKNTQTYRVVVEHGRVDDLQGVALTPGDGQLTLTWGASTGSHPPNLFWARWREAGTTAWLNDATLAGWKTGYGDGAPEATAADGQRVTGTSYVISGLTNGTEYEVELRGTRAGDTSYRVTNWLKSPWVTVKGTPGQTAAARTLTITPSAPSREYGGTDDLSYTVSGLVDGDAATDVVTGALARAAGDDAGSYAFDLSGLSIATAYAQKYALPAAPSVADYTITPRAITAISGVTVNTRPTDGGTTATFDTSAATGTGVLAAELADFRSGGLVASGAFPAATAGTHSLSVTYSLGDHGSFKAANYTLTSTTGTLRGEITQVNCGCDSRLMLLADGVPAEGGDLVTVVVGLGRPAGPGGVTVTLTAGGTATADADYTLSPTTVSIAAGATAGMSTVTVIDDAVDDDDETIVLNAAASASSLTASPLTLTIADNDDAPTLTITPRAPSREYGGTDDLSYTVGGLDPGDAATDVVTGSLSRAAGEDAGRYAFDLSGLSIAAAYAQKYALPAAPTVADYTITPRAITAVGGVTVNTRPADGTTAATFDTSAAAGTGVLAAELVDFRSGGLVVSGSFPATTPGAHSLSVTYSLQDSGTFKAGNYSLASTTDALQGELTGAVNAGCPTPADGDYDSDDDGLIEVCNLEQLNAIHWDPDGDGLSDGYHDRAYAATFPNAASGMGCPLTGCNGYELTADLDFDTNGNGRGDAGDKFSSSIGFLRVGWLGIGKNSLKGEFTAVFDGNGHVIRNLFINCCEYNGLFGETSARAVIRNVGLEDVLLNSDGGHVGGLVGHNGGTIINSYTTGAVSGYNGVGGLVGGSDDTSMIIGSYSTATVTGSADDVGGLVGGNEGTIVASYATGNVTGSGNADGNYVPGNDDGKGHAIGGLVGLNYEGQKIIASYATGAVSAPNGEKVGGLVGYNLGSITASYSTGAVSGSRKVSGLAHSDAAWVGGASARVAYWDTATSGRTASAQGAGKTTTELQSPTGYTGIYANWNVDLDRDGNGDDPWDFGTACQYPLLKYGGLNPGDQRAPCTPTPTTNASRNQILIAATVDIKVETTDDLKIQSMTLPQGFTIEPAFRPDHYDYRVIVPSDLAMVEVDGRFTTPFAEWKGIPGTKSYLPPPYTVGPRSYTAYIVTSEDLSVSEGDWDDRSLWQPQTGPGTLTFEDLLATLHFGSLKSHNHRYVPSFRTGDFDLALGETATVQIGLYKWKHGRMLGEPFAENTIKQVYTLTVNRPMPRADSATLYDLTISAGILNFDRDAAAHQANVNHDTQSVVLTPIPLHPQATATVNGADPATPVALDNGENVVNVVVTAADGITTKTYAITVVRDSLAAAYTALIARMYEWRNDPQWVSEKAHTDRWDRALLAFGETVADESLTPMTADEAQAFADRGSAWSRWVEVAAALRELEAAGQQQQGTPNQAPTVSAAIADATIVNESGTKQVSLAGAFSDADSDALTVTAASSDETKATVSVATDHSSLTVNAQARGTAAITVTANDGHGGTVDDAFTVTVKAAAVVAQPLADVSGLEVDATQDISLSGVFSDADGDALTIAALSSDETKVTVSVASDGSSLTATGVAEGTATITVTAEDSDGNSVSDAFDAPVARKYNALIAQMYQWRNDPQWSSYKSHTDRWDRALLAFGETVADTTLTALTADEAQEFADSGMTRWVEVAAALREIEAAGPQQQQGTPNRAPTVASALSGATFVNESGTKQVSLPGAFSDADNDALTIRAVSSNEAVATVLVSADYSGLTVSAQSRGMATITVTADDGRGGTVDDSFTVTVKAAPVVAQPLGDVSGLEEGATQAVPLSGVFSDADGDQLTITAASSDEAKATVTVASDGSGLTLSGVAEGTAAVTVTARDSDGNRVSDTFDVSVVAPQQQAPPPNQEPTVSSAIADVTIVNESGTKQVSLSGVFDDPDGDGLTVTAASSEGSVATVSVAADHSSLTVTAQARGTATITVTADDGKGGTVSDAFTITIKAAPVVASAISDLTGLEAGATQDVSLSGVFSDADGDALTITAASSDEAKATVSVAVDHSSLAVEGMAEGTATITVTAQDSDGNRVSDTFEVAVEPEPEQDPPPDEDSPNRPPTVAQPLPDISLEGLQWRQFSLPGVFHDPDGDELTFTGVSSNYGVASTWVSGSTLTVVATGTGTATITVTAEDPDGNRVSDEFEVTVTPAS